MFICLWEWECFSGRVLYLVVKLEFLKELWVITDCFLVDVVAFCYCVMLISFLSIDIVIII